MMNMVQFKGTAELQAALEPSEGYLEPKEAEEIVEDK